jgi:hypothetical protein
LRNRWFDPLLRTLSVLLATPGRIDGMTASEASAPRPSIGRIVHYTNLGDKDGKYPPETQAALITGVNEDGSVALHVFYKTGQFDMPSVPFAESPVRGHWNWPPRT